MELALAEPETKINTLKNQLQNSELSLTGALEAQQSAHHTERQAAPASRPVPGPPSHFSLMVSLDTSHSPHSQSTWTSWISVDAGAPTDVLEAENRKNRRTWVRLALNRATAVQEMPLVTSPLGSSAEARWPPMPSQSCTPKPSGRRGPAGKHRAFASVIACRVVADGGSGSPRQRPLVSDPNIGPWLD